MANKEQNNKVHRLDSEGMEPLRGAINEVLEAKDSGELECVVVLWKTNESDNYGYLAQGAVENCYFLVELVKLAILSSSINEEGLLQDGDEEEEE